MNGTTCNPPGDRDSRPNPVEQLVKLVQMTPSTTGVGECEEAIRSIGRVRSFLDTLEAEFATRLRQMHEAGKSEDPASIIAAASNTSARDARRKARRSEILAEADSFAGGLAAGVISGEHVDALANACQGLNDDTRSRLLESQAELVDFASRQTPTRLAKELRDLIALHEHDQGVSRDTQQRRDTFIDIRLEPSSGMYRVNGMLHPELGTAINSAIGSRVRKMVRDDHRLRTEPRGRLQAHALGELISTAHAVAAQGAAGVPRPAAQINVLIDLDTLVDRLHDGGVCETSDGATLPAWKVRQLACDGDILPVVLGGDSIPLDVGRTRRFFSPAQRAALRTMHPTCAMPGCDTSFERCEIHHLQPWEDGGRTNLDNGVPLCSRCHHLIHQPGWSTKMDPARVLTIVTPTGRTLVNIPAGRDPVPSDPGTDPPWVTEFGPRATELTRCG